LFYIKSPIKQNQPLTVCGEKGDSFRWRSL